METIRVRQEGFVTVLTIHRPEALNALSAEVLADLDTALDAVDPAATRCVVLTGAGEKAFVAGADIGSQATLTQAQALSWSRRGNAVFRKIETLPLPVIAAVNGYALGGGCELALACDIRLASENAVFGQPEVGLGITAGFGGTQRLPRLVGTGFAKEMLYSGIRVKADRALAMGLVNAVHPLESLLDEAIQLAEKIANNAPIAVRATKKAINEGMQEEIEESLETEAKLFSTCFETRDQKEGMAAFLEKRKAQPYKNK